MKELECGLGIESFNFQLENLYNIKKENSMALVMEKDMKTNIIYNIDCVEGMKKYIPDGSIDLVVTSPPYDNLRTYKNTLQWDFEIFKCVAFELFRITKEGGVVVWIVGDATIKGSETGTSFKQALYFKALGYNLHDTMIWTKDGGGAIGSNKTYTQNFEYMFVFSKGKINKFNLICDKINQSFKKDKSGVGRRRKDGTHKIEKRKPSKEFSKRNNYWYIPPQRGEHPAVFPEKLVEDHIISWSNPGDIVCDPFMGSGTTAKMAKKNNRQYVGFESVRSYIKIARTRINALHE